MRRRRRAQRVAPSDDYLNRVRRARGGAIPAVPRVSSPARMENAQVLICSY